MVRLGDHHTFDNEKEVGLVIRRCWLFLCRQVFWADSGSRDIVVDGGWLPPDGEVLVDV